MQRATGASMPGRELAPALSSPPGFRLPALARRRRRRRRRDRRAHDARVDRTTTPPTSASRAPARACATAATTAGPSSFADRESTPAPPAHGEHRFAGEPGQPPDAARRPRARAGPHGARRARRAAAARAAGGSSCVDDDGQAARRGRRRRGVGARRRPHRRPLPRARGRRSTTPRPDGLADVVAARLQRRRRRPARPDPQDRARARMARARAARRRRPARRRRRRRRGDVVRCRARRIGRAALAPRPRRASRRRSRGRPPGPGRDPPAALRPADVPRRCSTAEWTADAARRAAAGSARELGAVRDTEVLLDRLRDRVERLAAEDRTDAEPLLSRLLERWEDGAAVELLDRAAQPPLRRSCSTGSSTPHASPALLPEATEPAAERCCRPLVARAVEASPRRRRRRSPTTRPTRRSTRSGSGPSAAATPPRPSRRSSGKPAAGSPGAVAAVQDVLGEHQDAVVAEQWLRERRAGADAARGVRRRRARRRSSAPTRARPATRGPTPGATAAPQAPPQLAVSRRRSATPRRVRAGGRRRAPCRGAGGRRLESTPSSTGPATTTGASPRARPTRASPTRRPPLREVEEETGMRCRLGPELADGPLHGPHGAGPRWCGTGSWSPSRGDRPDLRAERRGRRAALVLAARRGQAPHATPTTVTLDRSTPRHSG